MDTQVMANSKDPEEAVWLGSAQPFCPTFSFSPIFNIEIFRHTFLGNCEV